MEHNFWRDNTFNQSINQSLFHFHLKLLVFSVTPFKIDQNKKSKPFNTLSPESGNRKKVDIQRLSPGFRSQQFFYKNVNLSLAGLKNVTIILYSNTRTVQIAEFPEISHLSNQHHSSLACYVNATSRKSLEIQGQSITKPRTHSEWKFVWILVFNCSYTWWK